MSVMNPLMVQMIQDMFGDAIYGVAKLFVRVASGGDGEIEGKKVYRTLIAGVLVTDETLNPVKGKLAEDIPGYNQDYPKDRMYECEVVIIPRRIFEGGPIGYRIDQILCGGYEKHCFYEREVPLSEWRKEKP